jgi:hypothetical protein
MLAKTWRFPLRTAEEGYRRKSETKWESHSLRQKWWGKGLGWAEYFEGESWRRMEGASISIRIVNIRGLW